MPLPWQIKMSTLSYRDLLYFCQDRFEKNSPKTPVPQAVLRLILFPAHDGGGRDNLDKALVRQRIFLLSSGRNSTFEVCHEYSLPTLQKLLSSFDECRYRDFFLALLDLEPILKQDPYLLPSTSLIIGELRLKAYQQFLDSFKW